MPRTLVLTLTLLVAPGCGAQTAGEAPRAVAAEADTVYTTGPATRDGTGRTYMGREIARVMGHRGAAWLERPDRAEEELPNRLVDALDLEADDVVADVGAGTGYFTFRLAERVPEGRVLAVDIQPEMLAIIEERAAAGGVGNVVPVRGAEDDPNLPEAEVDLALIVDAYHEFAYPREMARAILRALKPGGRLVLVEYRGEDPSVPIKPLHKMTEAQARRELESVGFEWVETQDFLPRQHILVFERPAEMG